MNPIFEMGPPPENRGPALRVNAGNRAECFRNEAVNSTKFASTEDFAAVFIARRYRLTPCMARVIASLADIGGRLA